MAYARVTSTREGVRLSVDWRSHLICGTHRDSVRLGAGVWMWVRRRAILESLQLLKSLFLGMTIASEYK